MSAVEFRDASGADWTHVAGLLTNAGLPVAGAADHLSHFVLAFSAGTLVARAEGVREVILLTETAPHYFLRFGFEHITRADAPDAVKVSVEFTGACCASAAVLRLRLP